jgi:hypothetical protein
MVEYLGIGSSKQLFLHGEVGCLLGYIQVFAYKGIIACQTPSSNPNLLMIRKLIVFELACEKSQLVIKITIERGLKVL